MLSGSYEESRRPWRGPVLARYVSTMFDTPPPAARISPSTARNREPILAVLKPRLPAEGLVLEIAAGAGEHAMFNAAACPGLLWRPTDPDPEALASIAAWRDYAALSEPAAPAAPRRRRARRMAVRTRRRRVQHQHDPHLAVGGDRGFDGGGQPAPFLRRTPVHLRSLYRDGDRNRPVQPGFRPRPASARSGVGTSPAGTW